MESRKIEQLLEKFYEGTSSSKEEHLLRQYFSNDSLPDHLKSLKPLFCHQDYILAHTKTNDLLKDRLECTIRLEDKRSKKLVKRRILLSIASVAAVLLLMFGIFSTPEPTSFEDTFNNPEQAYEEAKKALVYVSDHLNKGLVPLQESAAKLNKGIDKTSEISRLDIIQNFIKSE